ncbi:MAG: site-specific integrase [Dechloromonas sp.]|nr:site-specific integrase [Dechloromonas sp.]
MASIRQRAGRWQARVIRKGFPTESNTFDSYEDAVKWARSIETDIDRGLYRNRSAAEQISVKYALERYVQEVTPTKRGAKEESIRIKALQRRRLAQYSLATLTPRILAEFRDERLKTVSAGAVIRDLVLISSVINHARREWGVEVQNPCARVRKPSPPQGRNRLLTPDEEIRLLSETIPIRNRNPWLRPITILALETAMRRGELLALRWENIHLGRQTAFLPMTKNGTARTVPLSTKAIQTLRTLPKSTDGRVFPINAAALAAIFRRAANRARLNDLHFHDLRHTATSRLAEKLPNLVELGAVTGHKTVQMLKRYYHPKAEELAKKLG